MATSWSTKTLGGARRAGFRKSQLARRSSAASTPISALVRVTREELRATVHSGDALLISAGLSDAGTVEADRRGMERLDPSAVISLLRERGIDALVDGYGIHVYPGRNDGRGACALRDDGSSTSASPKGRAGRAG